jgi:hypothetical protein
MSDYEKLDRTDFVRVTDEEELRLQELDTKFHATYFDVLYVEIYTKGITDGYAWYWEIHLDVGRVTDEDDEEVETWLASGGGSEFIANPLGAAREALETAETLATGMRDRISSDGFALEY